MTQRLRLKIAAIAAVPLVSFGIPKPAAAFGFGDIFDIAGQFAPFVTDLIGFDISPYQSIIANSTGFASAITKGDFGGAFESVIGTLGDYGIVAPSKLKDTIALGSEGKYAQFANYDFGGGLSLLKAQDLDDATELATSAQIDAGLGEDAQTNLVEKSEGTATAVDASVKFSKMSGQTKVSQKILRNISAQQSVNAALMGQLLSEQRGQGISLKQTNAILADIRAKQNADKRVNRASNTRKTKGTITSAGMFSALVSPSDVTNTDNYGGQ